MVEASYHINFHEYVKDSPCEYVNGLSSQWELIKRISIQDGTWGTHILKYFKKEISKWGQILPRKTLFLNSLFRIL